MKMYPPEVAKHVAFLDKYVENKELNRFDLIHLYPKGLAYPNGYYDSRFFEIVAFNTKKMEKRNFGSNHDAIDFGDALISRAHVYADGAYVVKLSRCVEVVCNTQLFWVVPCSD